MLLFATTITPRLQQAAVWLGNYLFGRPLQIITQEKELPQNDIIFNYSQQVLPFTCFQIQPHVLLFERDIRQQNTEVKYHNKLPFFFATTGHFPFDLLAASFYLMQRYEEYLPHQKDKYGRYAHTNSLAGKNNFLHLPLIDLWMLDFKAALQENFKGKKLPFIERTFHFTPTYDIDIAYDKRGKGWLRNVGGLYRSLYKLPLPELAQQFRMKVANEKDRFDVYEELAELHTQYALQPIYFFLLAQVQKGLDKNISPKKKVYQQLIQLITSQYKTGIHLSTSAQNSQAMMQAEKDLLANISQKAITANRNHYLLFTLPHTYQLLQKNPLLITEEFSMGYGTTNGFRASTCTPYYWYNLQTEQSSNMQVFPFCYMEANSIFQQNETPEEALNEMKQLYTIVKQVNGLFITIFHNHLIGLDTRGRHWMEMYRQFLSEVL